MNLLEAPRRLLHDDRGNERNKDQIVFSRAAKRGHLTTVRYLVEQQRADIEKANIHGWTPWLGAVT